MAKAKNARHDFLKRLGIEEVNSGVQGVEWTREPAGGELVSYDPTTGEPIGRVLQASEKEYQEVVAQAQEEFLRWRLVPAPRRGLAVRALADALRAVKDDLGRLIALEMGKVLPEGKGEVQEMVDVADFAVGLSRQLYGLTMPSERPAHRIQEQWHPLGIVGVITAFNFPAAVWSWNATLAAVCGDSMVWKPSSLTPLVAVAISKIAHRIFKEHGHPAVSTLLVGKGSIVGDRIAKDPRIPLVSFTGSSQQGRSLATNVVSHYGRTILELGGNNAVIVMDDANLDLALRAVLFAAIGTAGQRCTSLRRLILHRPIARKFTDRLAGAYRSLSIGDPLAEGTSMGPLVDRGAVDDMMKALAAVRQQGGEIVHGGEVLSGPAYKSGCFVSPALVKILPGAPIVKEETFAPVLYLLEARDLEEAIHIQNDVPQGLSSGIFTTNVQYAETFLSARGSDCGIANVNVGTSGAEIGGAFGGEKETGGGRESGSDSWKQYMRRQTNTINWSDDLPLAQGIEFG
ncbi:MAG: aldehyde dehydrogenase family protein [Planctomycetes bacterium]|nr:aldehyde dehydrogenase family protein [Planctomycetota bacterium]